MHIIVEWLIVLWNCMAALLCGRDISDVGAGDSPRARLFVVDDWHAPDETSVAHALRAHLREARLRLRYRRGDTHARDVLECLGDSHAVVAYREPGQQYATRVHLTADADKRLRIVIGAYAFTERDLDFGSASPGALYALARQTPPQAQPQPK